MNSRAGARKAGGRDSGSASQMIHKIPRWVLYGSAVLAFNAGFINCIALLSFTHTGVSHVTGTVTQAADAAATLDLPRLRTSVLIIVSFFCGAVISGIVVRSEALKAGRRYGLALCIEGVLLLLTAELFRRGSFAGELTASASCGLQNALVATYSGSVIRTTHLTGILSDLGSAVGNRLAGGSVNRIQVVLHASIFFCFAAGAILGSLGFAGFGYGIFRVPALLVLMAAGAYAVWSSRTG